MPSITRKHFRCLTHKTSGAIGASGTYRAYGFYGTLEIN
jgi:hypothetical protein